MLPSGVGVYALDNMSEEQTKDMSDHPINVAGFKFYRKASCAQQARELSVSRQYVQQNQVPRPSPRFNDGYPTEQTLSIIRDWPVENFYMVRDLHSYCRDAWHWGESMWGNRRGETRNGEKWIAASTGGWSGNELIIGALEENLIFWTLSWLESSRGGHYKFITGKTSES